MRGDEVVLKRCGREVTWPEEKRCAAAVTVNLDAETFWLALSPEAKNMPKTLSMGQYGMKRGVERVLCALEERGIKGTFFVPGFVAEAYSDQIRELALRGHEIGLRGYCGENMALLSEGEQRQAMQKGFDAIRENCGITPRGFRAANGEVTAKTMELAAELGMVYSSNLSDSDLPYERDYGGSRLVEIPIHSALYDLPYFAFNYKPAFPAGQGRIAGYSGALSNWRDEFDGYRQYGLCYVLQLDPQTIGNPGRIALLEELLDHMKQKGGVWYATCGEIADHCQKGDAVRK